VDENKVGIDTLTENEPQAGFDSPARSAQSSGIDRRYLNLDAVSSAQQLKVSGEREVRRSIGEEDRAERHAASN